MTLQRQPGPLFLPPVHKSDLLLGVVLSPVHKSDHILGNSMLLKRFALIRGELIDVWFGLCASTLALCPTCAPAFKRIVRLVPSLPCALSDLCQAGHAAPYSAGTKYAPVRSSPLTRLDARRAPNITPDVKLSQTPPRHEPATRATPVMAYAQSPALSRALIRLDARRAPNVTPGIKLP